MLLFKILKITIWPCKSKEALKGDKERHRHHSLVHFLPVKTSFCWNTFGFGPLVKRNKRFEYLTFGCALMQSLRSLQCPWFSSNLFSLSALFCHAFSTVLSHKPHQKEFFNKNTKRWHSSPQFSH